MPIWLYLLATLAYLSLVATALWCIVKATVELVREW